MDKEKKAAMIAAMEDSCGFSRGTSRTEQGTAKNDAGGYQSRDLHPQRASRHVTHALVRNLTRRSAH